MFSQTVLELRRKSTLCTLGPPITWKGILNTIQNSQPSIPTRFIDEQDGGRDRSASPNYHSLIYGKKPSEKELASNGAEVKTDKSPLYPHMIDSYWFPLLTPRLADINSQARLLENEGEDSLPGQEDAGRGELET